MMALATCFTPFQPGLWNSLTLSGCALDRLLQHRENFLLAHSLAVSGMMMPALAASFSSMRLIRTVSGGRERDHSDGTKGDHRQGRRKREVFLRCVLNSHRPLGKVAPFPPLLWYPF